MPTCVITGRSAFFNTCFQITVRSLAEFVISYAVHIVISVRFFSVYVRKLSAQVIRVGHFLFVRVDHLQQSVVAVVGPLCHIGGDGLVRHDQRTSRLGHFAHLAVEVFYGARAVLAEHQPADAVLRGVAPAVVVPYVVLRVVGVVDVICKFVSCQKFYDI